MKKLFALISVLFMFGALGFAQEQAETPPTEMPMTEFNDWSHMAFSATDGSTIQIDYKTEFVTLPQGPVWYIRPLWVSVSVEAAEKEAIVIKAQNYCRTRSSAPALMETKEVRLVSARAGDVSHYSGQVPGGFAGRMAVNGVEQSCFQVFSVTRNGKALVDMRTNKEKFGAQLITK